MVLIFNCDTAEYVRQAMLPKMSIINIGVVEDKKLLVMMTRGENSIYIIDYTSWKGIAKLGDLPSSQMFVFPFSRATVEAQMQLYNQAIDADALIYTSMDDGCICSGLIKSANPNDELQWTWIPQHLYSTKESSSSATSSGLKILNNIWYNVILDILIVSDVTGVVYLIENTFYYTLKSNLKTSIRSDVKQPFFSFGFSSSTKANSVAQLTSESHAIKADKEKEKLPYFSFGFFKSKPKEESKDENPHTQPSQPTQVKPTNSSSSTSGRKRVQINKNDILSGNYSFSKSEEQSKSSESKGKVDNDKINEILKRIERHTTKSNQEEKPSIEQLVKDLKETARPEDTKEETKRPDNAEDTKDSDDDAPEINLDEESEKPTEETKQDKDKNETSQDKQQKEQDTTETKEESSSEQKPEDKENENEAKDKESNQSEDEAI